ncbi:MULTISPECIES: efflux RND transporter periplasmic adaptor subunit [unclassified Novosphingobium]|uniref:efflux RND transporter periplasmic adaptor subunit n=1 Tax=unclassified Novosphingobium TaxID=2644732 RepID=UPI00086996B4|nr:MULTISPECIES: efflux RND transporter periplasmic adaptor subunit [unclassified Novosphingobium]MBF5092647.1 efflux RND transporter periplasmic adaptor subunit [Novosphingobium sp. NBM11]ODU72264.1 MAG: efflux transporter periplasmic adaptor subunit [Novosphingobium sp. SCN 66-18]RQW45070.1 efflux RND transporter periplasmic adaptor subunit [Novosphingobium sp. LASN5T]
MRGHLFAFAAIGMATAFGLPLAGCADSGETTQTAKAPAGPRLTLAMQDTTAWQDVSAEIATVDQAQVMARIPGILSTLTVKAGDTVAKGQAIGRIVDSQLGFQAGAYGAQAAAAQAQAAQAAADLQRVKFLHDNGVYAKARLDQAQAAASAAQAQVRAAQAQQAAVGAVAGQGTVVAPTAGRVLRADVPAGAPVAPGMVIAVITAGPTIVRLEMPESLAGKAHAGSRVSAAGMGEGRVIKVYPSVNAGKVMADVDMPGIDNSLIGRRVAARVEIGTRKALVVPARFVTTRYGIDYLTVLAKDGSATQVPVQTAPVEQADRVEILSGANPGDTIVADTGKGADR